MKRGLITSILALTFGSLQAQPLSTAPRLVVTLTIDQLRTDYMEAFSSLYGERGFKRLLTEGKVYCQMEMPFKKADRASALATLYTGATPSLHGIIAQNWLDRSTLRPVKCMDDPDFMGNYTDESSSPSQLLVSTLADELKVATRNQGLVYAIAPFRDAAILAAGHNGNGAFWLNESTGKWCSTTYYPEFPWWLTQYNEQEAPDLRIPDMVWAPALPVIRYDLLPGGEGKPFKHKPNRDAVNRFRDLMTTPLINDEVNRVAERLLDKNDIGRDHTTDLLALTYYAGTYRQTDVETRPTEIQDMYVRLDASLANLLDLLDRKIGLRNILFCLASTGYTAPEYADTPSYRIPGGEFYLNRCATLLNMFLMATYGEGQYVEAYHDLQIYLNHSLIEKKQLELAEIQEKAAGFLVQFSGVDKVYSAYQLLRGAWSPDAGQVCNGFHRKRSGDLLIEVLPGWTVIQEGNVKNPSVRYAQPPTPFILLGNGITAETIRIPASIDRIAPTLCGALHIRAPNACEAQPLQTGTNR